MDECSNGSRSFCQRAPSKIVGATSLVVFCSSAFAADAAENKRRFKLRRISGGDRLVASSDRSFCDHFELRFLMLRRACSDHYIEPSGLDHAVHVQIQKRKFVWSDGEINSFALARRE